MCFHVVMLHIVVNMVIMSGDVACCSVVCGTLLGVSLSYYVSRVTDYIRDQLTSVIIGV